MSYVNTTSNLFPSANCVYVDNDYLKLRKKGLLAYNTLQNAVQAWRDGGEAQRKFGTPSATSPCAIILGVGRLETHNSTSAYGIDVEYLSIVGQGKDVSILASSIFTTGYLLETVVFNYGFFNFTVTSTSSLLLRQSGLAMGGEWNGIKFTGNASGAPVQVAMLAGRIVNCTFDFSSSTTTTTVFQLIGGTSSGDILNCTFLGSSTVTTLYSYTGTNFTGNIRNCTFSGNVVTSLITLAGTDSYFGEISDCTLLSNSSTATGIVVSSASATEFMIRNCNIIGLGIAIDAIMTFRSRIQNCYLSAGDANNHAVNVRTGSTGGNISHCRVLGHNTGRAINSVDAITMEVTNCTLRMPNGDVAGSSVSSNLTNRSPIPYNSETSAATQF